MSTVRELLQAKGTQVWSVGPDAPVIDALRLMAEKGIGALVVLENGRLAGIISERDYARKVVLHGKSSHDVPVREIMTSEVFSVRPDQTVEECIELMTERRFRHLPVLENGAVSGLISIGDVVKSIMSNQKHLIRQLEGYISGR